MRGEKWCKTANKRGFTSKKAAMDACHGVHNRIRVYMCPSCHLFHVTSEIRPPRQRQRRPRVED